MMMDWQGAYDATKTYEAGDVVTNAGGIYIANQHVPINTTPPSGAWDVVAVPPPAAITWKGVWLATSTYHVNDAVSYVEGGATDAYVVVVDPPTHEPPTDPRYWQALSKTKDIQYQANFIAAAISASSTLASAIIAAVSVGINYAFTQAQAAKASADAIRALGDIATNVGKINKLEGDTSKLKDDFGNLDTDVVTLKTDVGKIDTTVDSLKTTTTKIDKTARESKKISEIVANEVDTVIETNARELGGYGTFGIQ